MYRVMVSVLATALVLALAAPAQAQPTCGGPAPDMFIVFDKSGSMSSGGSGYAYSYCRSNPLNCCNVYPTIRWCQGKRAVDTLTSGYQDKVNFGLALFHSSYLYKVGVAPNHAAAIMNVLDQNYPYGGTNIGRALQGSRGYLTSLTSTNSKYVLLVTDGCTSSYPSYTAEAAALLTAGVKTYVVGFSSGVCPSQLTAIAQAGGTNFYFQANDEASLKAALNTIGGEVTCCGNGLPNIGEECDDGNTTDGDGCSAACKIEVPPNSPPTAVCANQTLTADAACVACASVDGGSTDPDGDTLTITQTPACDYNLGLNLVTLTVSDGLFTDTCTATVVVEDNTAPALTCEAPQNLNADAQCLGIYAFGATATDNCDTITPVQSPAGSSWALGTSSVTFTGTDAAGNSASCATSVTVTDVTPPTIDCNAADILPKDAPVTYTATADDNCSVTSVVVTSYDCWAINGAGKTIDKTGSCVVAYTGAALSITDAGGVGTNIDWTVLATDGSGNTFTKKCSIKVLRPANQGVGNGPEGSDPGNSNQGDPNNSNDENGGTPGNPGKKGGKK